MNIPFVMKRCNKCGRWLVASTVNFHKSKKCKYGLQNYCKECKRQWHQDNKEELNEYNRQWKENNPDKVAKHNRKWRENNLDKITEYKKQYYQIHKEEILENKRQWRENNPDKVAEYNKKRRQARIDAIIAQKRAEYEAERAPLVAEKTCKCCGRTLPASEFYANKNSKDHLASDCKECAKKKSQERYYHNLETKGWA